MTTLLTVSVDSIDGPTLRGRVHLINPDVPYVPEENEFPLSLLVDAWWHLNEGYLSTEGDEESGHDRYPFTPEQGQDITAGMRLRSEFLELYELILGKKIRVDGAGYLLADDNKTVLEPRRRAKHVYTLDGGSGYDGISDYVTTSGDADAFSERAAVIVTSYEISPYRNVPLLSEVAAVQDPDGTRTPEGPDGPADLEDHDVWDLLVGRSFAERPHAEITVTVSDPGYLEHLTPGMRWETTMTGHVC